MIPLSDQGHAGWVNWFDGEISGDLSAVPVYGVRKWPSESSPGPSTPLRKWPFEGLGWAIATAATTATTSRCQCQTLSIRLNSEGKARLDDKTRIKIIGTVKQEQDILL